MKTVIDYVAPEKGLTAKGKHSSSRAEAWAAWEAARLEFLRLRKGTSRSKTNFEKKFGSHVHKWFMFALSTSPNRGEVTVELIDGSLDKYNILTEKGPAPKERLELWKIAPEYSEERTRQELILSQGRVPTWAEILQLEGWEEIAEETDLARIEVKYEFADSAFFGNQIVLKGQKPMYREEEGCYTLFCRRWHQSLSNQEGIPLWDNDSKEVVQFCPYYGVRLYRPLGSEVWSLSLTDLRRYCRYHS